MACSTCGGKVDAVGESMSNDTLMAIAYCGVCGTLCIGRSTLVPKLVERCREFAKEMGPEWMAQNGHLVTAWKRLGIAESIGEK